MDSFSGQENNAAPRPTWDEFWFALALLYSTRGTCDRLRTSCLLVDSHNHLISAGYNGSVPGQPHCDDVGHLMVGGHCLRTLHSEENALLHAPRENLDTCTAYLLASPCVACMKKLVAKGIRRILFTRDFLNVEDKDFIDQLVAAHNMEFRKVDIPLDGLMKKMMDMTRKKGGSLYQEQTNAQVLPQEEAQPQTQTEDTSILAVERISPYAKMPTRAYVDDAGFDVYANEDLEIAPYTQATIGTGLRLAIPPGFAGFVWDKSGLAANYSLKTAGGVIDAGYRGELKVIVHNLGGYPYIVRRGEKIAQLIIKEIPRIQVVEAPVGDETERRESGFGSTGLA